MKIGFLTIMLLLAASNMTIAHSGRTDSSGGHNCSQKSKEKGLCAGYHYHYNGHAYSAGGDKLAAESGEVQQDKSADSKALLHGGGEIRRKVES